MSNIEKRIVTREKLNQLDSVEKLIAEQYILSGRWIVEDEGIKPNSL